MASSSHREREGGGSQRPIYVTYSDPDVMMHIHKPTGEYATCASDDKSFEAHINLDRVVAVEMVQSKVR
jgi:hypothetical protein